MPPQRGARVALASEPGGVTFPGEEALVAGGYVLTYTLGAAGHLLWDRRAVHQWERLSDGQGAAWTRGRRRPLPRALPHPPVP